MWIMYIPRNPKTPPRIARKIFWGRLLTIPNSFSIVWSNTVIRMLEDPIVAVIDAPTLLKPVK